MKSSDYKLKMRLFIFLLVLAWCYDDYDDFGDIVTPDEPILEDDIKRETKPRETESAAYKDISYDDDFVDIERPSDEKIEEELVVEEEPQAPLDWWSCKNWA